MKHRSRMRVLQTSGIALLAMMVIMSSAVAEQIVIQYSFENPQLSTVTVGDVTFDRVYLPAAPNYGNVGQPLLPASGAYILLPYGTAVESIDIIPGDRTELGEDYYIEPATHPISLSAAPGTIEPPVPDQTIYSSDRPFPDATYEEVGMQSFRGYQILVLRLRPVQYQPASGKLFYYSDLTAVVNTGDSLRSESLFRGLDEDANEIVSKVDNTGMINSYSAAGIRGSKSYDLLIITTPSLAESFQPLKDHHDLNGIATEIRTTSQVGSSFPDGVRDYIRERFQSDGIQYVLIGGDDDLIPAKDMFVRTSDDEWALIEYNMPTDLYFACLDGPFNYNGNEYWGEPDDGEGGGDVDLIADVYVGRAPVGDVVEADRFVSKTLQYLGSQESYLREVLLVGEWLGFGGLTEYGGTSMDELVDVCETHQHTTHGFPSSVYDINKLYDREWPGNDWPDSILLNRINDNLHVINHLGHGAPQNALKLSNDELLTGLSNDNHCIVYSQTCLAGHFDSLDCWAEFMNIKTDFGAFATIMNAREGFVGSGTDGPSHRFNRQFWDAVFNPAEDKRELGCANHDSKEDNLYRIDEDCMRWCCYGLNLFGDPTVVFKVPKGVAFEYPNGIPETVTPNEPTVIEVDITGTYGGTHVPGSGQFHYSVDGAAFVTNDMNVISSSQYEAVLPALGYGSTIDFYFSADEDSLGTFSDPKEAPDEIYSAFPATDSGVIFEDDFEDDMGWTVSGDATDGHWERGVPIGSGDAGDPTTDFDGSGMCYLTGNAGGDSDVDGGTTTLISPTINLSMGDATLHYARWYSNDAGDNPHSDTFSIYISNDDGANWVPVETVGPVEQSSGGWYEHSFTVSDFVTPTSQVKLRFDASDLNGNSVVEAAVDALSVRLVDFEGYHCGDADGSGSIDIDDIVYLISYIFLGDPAPDPIEAGDADCTDDIDIGDVVYLISHIFTGGSVPCAACP